MPDLPATMSDRPNTPDSRGWWSGIWRWLCGDSLHDGAVQGLDEERRALQWALLHKRRNDQVRHNELNALRESIRAQRTVPPAGTQPPAPPSLLGTGGMRSGGSRGAEPDKSRTIEQIARIEAQMARHWTPRTAESSGLCIAAPVVASAGPIASRHLQTRADGSDMSIDLVTVESPAQTAEPQALLTHPALTEVAVRYANGRLDEARQMLAALQTPEDRTPLACLAGLMLLELLWAAGDVEGFEDWAAEWAERFGQPIPRWPMVQPPPASAEAMSGTATTAIRPIWVCPPRLDAAAVTAVAALAERGDAALWLDWSGLLSVDLEAAERLAAVFEHWANLPLALRWQGSAVLRRRLKAGTPSGRRDNPPVWWRLRLAALRLVGRRDEFDLVALDYCVTYGELPPLWHDPLTHVEPVEALPEPAPGESAFSAVATPRTGGAILAPGPDAGPAVRLEGVLDGDAAPVLQVLDAAVQAVAPHASSRQEGVVPCASRALVIDARRLERVDFAAAGALLQGLLAAQRRGVRVELDGVSHLLAALFQLVGIAEVATVRLRQY